MEFSEASYQIIAELLAARTGQQLTDNRKWRLTSALSGVFREHGISNIDQLVCLLDASSDPSQPGNLANEVVEALLNNETYFFRDKPTFDQIPQEILPILRERRARLRRLSIWCAGCSTGQEAHSLAMLFDEQKDLWAGWSIEILGTDISKKAIRTAKNGLYSQFEVQRGLGVTEMLCHFDEAPDGWQLRDNVKRFSRFEQHNLLTPPPRRGKFDLILCRNVLLYFDAETRSLIFNRLASALAGDGYLMLGAGETASARTSAFAPSGKRASIFELGGAAKANQHEVALAPL
ncbi:protein-glutamate O-methyltransferase CheR [uncultured Erythrobacter sp.]|uniref:CheR family methyltransferase n=1 Tax=uncultured Erythrobacter sp. TaxID=263913 RepID=UPI0026202CAC|nr:protein-glutamate O-methyltransferase CheR [uncultured Erythrobacter sp.]